MLSACVAIVHRVWSNSNLGIGMNCWEVTLTGGTWIQKRSFQHLQLYPNAKECTDSLVCKPLKGGVNETRAEYHKWPWAAIVSKHWSLLLVSFTLHVYRTHSFLPPLAVYPQKRKSIRIPLLAGDEGSSREDLGSLQHHSYSWQRATTGWGNERCFSECIPWVGRPRGESVR